MTNIDEKRSLRLRQALRDMGNYGVKLRKPEDSPFYDQPVDYEAEKKRFEPVQEEEQEDMERSLPQQKEQLLPKKLTNEWAKPRTESV